MLTLLAFNYRVRGWEAAGMNSLQIEISSVLFANNQSLKIPHPAHLRHNNNNHILLLYIQPTQAVGVKKRVVLGILKCVIFNLYSAPLTSHFVSNK